MEIYLIVPVGEVIESIGIDEFFILNYKGTIIFLDSFISEYKGGNLFLGHFLKDGKKNNITLHIFENTAFYGYQKDEKVFLTGSFDFDGNIYKCQK